MLKAAGYSLPNKVHIHGFLTVNGEKMSKRKGTAFKAATYLKHLNPSALRYYYASKLGSKLDDLDLNFEEFTTKVNADLVGKVVNLASRSAKFVKDVGLSKTYPDDGGLSTGRLHGRIESVSTIGNLPLARLARFGSEGW